MSAQAPVMPAPSETAANGLQEPGTPVPQETPSATPGQAQAAPHAPQNITERISTPALITQMLEAAPKTSDLIFSPGRAPMVEVKGQLRQMKIDNVTALTPEDTARIAGELIGRNTIAVQKLRDEGSCDISYSLPKL